ncbi:hypothetical protein BO86DRAFT_370777 [Aspergillus japonicus CBS 114.51]|uniref:DUF7702 domain-containing protein n=2 Tax=Aspergillus TaxID=5052 RepID=A0A2V5GSZ9_ASPV1|nr:hypothetical protein BO86DRAFT_370777 [Aspergillus japonicus CBS 114.51]PYI14415.1 hypothetical protein BO99DRAFT_394746 [Aspergillus violaceofuscus CBS 115571]RAH77396.1 hypothetical protein BO86DRAFT_370777 [Aspergillus japonicus CBS 114.51]
MADYNSGIAIISPENRYVAIVEVVLFSIIQLVQFLMRYNQEWRYWHHRKQRRPARCFLYSWWGLLGILSQIRIADSAMVISNRHPNKSMLIAESVLQTIGLSPLLFEVSLVLLRSGQAGRTGPGNSRYPKHVRFLLHFFRFPVIISIVLVVVGDCIGIPGCMYAGGAVFAATFCFVCGLVSWLAVTYRSVLSPAGHSCVMIVLGALPFLVVRVVYFLLAEFGPRKFSPIDGSEGVMVGMGLVMEVLIIIILLLARAVAEPLWPAKGGPTDPEV